MGDGRGDELDGDEFTGDHSAQYENLPRMLAPGETGADAVDKFRIVAGANGATLGVIGDSPAVAVVEGDVSPG